MPINPPPQEANWFTKTLGYIVAAVVVLTMLALWYSQPNTQAQQEYEDWQRGPASSCVYRNGVERC